MSLSKLEVGRADEEEEAAAGGAGGGGGRLGAEVESLGILGGKRDDGVCEGVEEV